jgi:hypothetical protein
VERVTGLDVVHQLHRLLRGFIDFLEERLLLLLEQYILLLPLAAFGTYLFHIPFLLLHVNNFQVAFLLGFAD